MKTREVQQPYKHTQYLVYTAKILQYAELVKLVTVSVTLHFTVDNYPRKRNEFKATYLNTNYYRIIKRIRHYV
jgi:hypothetical protein